jgi:hypothetical protein
MRDIIDWLLALISHWQYWASGSGLGGFVVLVSALVERLINKKMSKKTYVLIFIVFFSVGASFMAWRDEHGLRIKSEASNGELRSAIEKKDAEINAKASAIDKRDKEIEELKGKISEPLPPPSASLRYGTSEIASDLTGYLVRIPITSEGPSTAKQFRFITEGTVEPSVLSDKDEELEWLKFIRKYPRSKWSHPEDFGMGDMRAFVGGVNGDAFTALINSPNGQMYFRGIAVYQTNIGERTSELCRRFHGPVWTPCSGHNRTIP